MRIDDRRARTRDRGATIDERGSTIVDRGLTIEDRRPTIEDGRSMVEVRRSGIDDRRSKIDDRGSTIEDRRSTIITIIAVVISWFFPPTTSLLPEGWSCMYVYTYVPKGTYVLICAWVCLRAVLPRYARILLICTFWSGPRSHGLRNPNTCVGIPRQIDRSIPRDRSIDPSGLTRSTRSISSSVSSSRGGGQVPQPETHFNG